MYWHMCPIFTHELVGICDIWGAYLKAHVWQKYSIKVALCFWHIWTVMWGLYVDYSSSAAVALSSYFPGFPNN